MLELIDERLELAWPADRWRLRRELRSLEQALRRNKPCELQLAHLNQEIERSIVRWSTRRAGLPKPRFDNDLPITARREEIAHAIAGHQVVVVCGETGSGKSTQLPKICLALGRGVDGAIGHTQPRRIAARNVAARIAEELGSPLGSDVGYKVRFTDATQERTYVKLMTDGVLLAETHHDRWLNAYDTIILDEAHERSLNIDFLLGFLKRLLPRRPELKLIVTSATIDAERFSRHFADATGDVPVLLVAGRTWPVEVRYQPPAAEKDGDEPDWQQALLDAVDELARIDDGDILVFLPTEQEIHAASQALRRHAVPGDRGGRETEIVPLYARLSTAEQQRVFQPHDYRRIVLATNVAESSLTVPGVRYVIDTGTARISRYSARSKVQRLPIEQISRASADQRMGRCGRVAPGICIRLYAAEDYESRERFTAPEIQRSNLAAVVLRAKALNLGELDEFPFLDPPQPEAVRDGYATLFELSALDERRELTDLGRTLARLPIDPRLGRILLAAADERCLAEALVIASALELQDPRLRPSDRQEAADEAHKPFVDERSDFVGLLKLWDFYHDLKATLSRNQLRKSCRDHFLSYNRLREWTELHRQLRELTAQAGLEVEARRHDYDALHRALVTGFLSNLAQRCGEREYTVAGGGRAHLWPGSAVYDERPKWLLAGEVIETSRRYLRTVARIHPRWIEPAASHLVKRDYREPHWDPGLKQAMVYERLSLFGLNIVRRRRVRLSPIDPEHARELLIGQGLVCGGYETRAKFLAHNRQLLEDLERWQRKVRRHGLLRGEQARYDFYDHRIPADVCDGAGFERWRRSTELDQPSILCMSEADLLVSPGEPIDLAAFPDTITVRQMTLPLEYHFEPGHPRDGITITVPLAGFRQLDAKRLDWLVPGLLEEKVVALIKSLPKPLRRPFVPAPDTARLVLGELRFGEGSFALAVARALTRIAGQPITSEAFRVHRLEDHLRMRVRVVDGSGRTVAAGRDLDEIGHRLRADAASEPVVIDQAPWNRDGITCWDFGELPEVVEIPRAGLTLVGYPALIDRGDAVSVRLVNSAETATWQSRAGLRRLFVLAVADELERHVEWLPNLRQILLEASPLADFRRHLAELIADRALFYPAASEPHDTAGGEFRRNAPAFATRLAAARERLTVAVQDVLPLVTILCHAYQRVRTALERPAAPVWQYAADDMAAQLAELTATGFLTTTPWQWLQAYPRYLRAIELRLEKLARGETLPDWSLNEQIASRWQRYLELARSKREQGLFDPALEHYRWLLEEFRVSLFAQSLGTAVPVSQQRLDAAWTPIVGQVK
jgi:ATP-dependent helicase HrpA